MTGLAMNIVFFIKTLSGNVGILALILTMAVTILFGMGVPTTAAYVLVASLAGSVLIELGFDKIAERIYQYSEVTSVYLMSGAFDFTVIIEGKTMREVAQFVSEKLSPMDSVLSTATHFVLKKYKDHGTVMCGKAEDERMMITP